LVARTRHAGVELRATVNGDLSAIPSAVELAAYRVIQEAVTNIVRHSGARSARVSVVVSAAAVDIEVEDDGRGIAPDFAEADGSGIRGMRERAQALAGTVDIARGADGVGTVVRARLPFGRQP
jgi:signal transduction histidine kinase